MKTIILSANSSWYLYNMRASTIKDFLKLDYKFICIAPKDSFTEKLESLGCICKHLAMSSKSTNPLRDIFLFCQFFFYYSTIKPFVIFHFTIKNNIYGTWAAGILRIPTVNNISGLGTAFLNQGTLNFFVRILYKLSQRLAYKVFCQNPDDLQFLIDKKLVPISKLGLLPGSGVDLTRFNPSLKKLFPTKNIFTFIYVGRMLKDKGLIELVDAVALVNKEKIICNLNLCGFTNVDNASSISQELIDEWKNLSWINWIGPSETVELEIAKSDCLVLPSYREGMPKSLLEAGAIGIPVIATDVPGCRNIVDDGKNGLLCQPKDSKDLARALNEIMLKSKTEILKMSNNARAKIELEFDEKIVIKEAIRVLNELA